MLVTRFRQEALAAGCIRHPNIIAVTDFGFVARTMPFLLWVSQRVASDILAEKASYRRRSLDFINAVASGLVLARQTHVHPI